jgi:hypothetical protein
MFRKRGRIRIERDPIVPELRSKAKERLAPRLDLAAEGSHRGLELGIVPADLLQQSFRPGFFPVDRCGISIEENDVCAKPRIGGKIYGQELFQTVARFDSPAQLEIAFHQRQERFGRRSLVGERLEERDGLGGTAAHQVLDRDEIVAVGMDASVQGFLRQSATSAVASLLCGAALSAR